VPVQATVSIFHSSGFDPHVTSAAGKGYIIVPGLQDILAITDFFGKITTFRLKAVKDGEFFYIFAFCIMKKTMT
jgi:hypothetical protein